MPVSPQIDSALTGFRRALKEGRVAHAWMVCGPPRAGGVDLADVMIRLLFCRAKQAPCGVCPACRQITSRAHADVIWIEPESKSRQIRIDDIRDTVLLQMAQTTYEGGWRACVLVCAERMNEAAQNAILKTLEEPPAKSLLILLTEDPQQLLPTIASRCQKIRLGGVGSGLLPDIRNQVLELLARSVGSRPCERLALVSDFRNLFDRLREDIETTLSERNSACPSREADPVGEVREARIEAIVRERRNDVLRLLMDWQRDVLALTVNADVSVLRFPDREQDVRREAVLLDPTAAFLRIETVEALGRRLNRNIPADLAFESFFREKHQMRSGSSEREI